MTPPNSQPSYAPPPQNNSQATQVTYAGQTEAELRAEYERERAANPGFFGGILTLDDYLRYKQQSAQYQNDQEKQLEQVVENYRPPLSPAGSYYMGYDHNALKGMVTENMAPTTANEQGEAWTKIGNTLAQLQTDLTSATAASKGAWQGAAAESAQGYFTNVATWSGNAAQGAQLTGNKLYTQSTAAEQAKNAMPEPVDFSTADAYKMLFSEPNPFKWAGTIDQIEQKFEEKQQAHERAAEVMTTMSTSFQESGSTMPAFSPPPPMDSGSGTGDGNQTGTGQIGSRPTIPSGTGTGTGTGSGLGELGVPGGGTGGTGGGNTNQSGWTGPGTGGGNTNLPGGGGGGNTNLPGGGNGLYPPGGGLYPPGTGPGGRPNVPPGGRPGLNGPGTGGRPGGGPGGGGGAGGGRGAGGPGGLAAAGRGGMGGMGGGFGPGGSSGALGDTGRAGSGGFGPGGSGGLAGAAAGAAGRGGAAGMGAGGGAAGGRGQGDEDKEHKAASYLVETEDVFGDGTMVAPPVIGG